MLRRAPALLAVQRRRSLGAAYIFLTAIRFFINPRGALSIDVHHWNTTPVSVDPDPARVWDWTDPPFLR
jgi:hypothetical protein